jgi:hypothetical protein
MDFFKLHHVSYRKNGESNYVTYEGRLLGLRVTAIQWQGIAIPYADARPAHFEVHFLGPLLSSQGYLHGTLMLPMVIWMVQTRARWELDADLT